MTLSPAVSTLCENPNQVFLDVAKLLITYADNILRFPNEEKYRSIRIGNPTFSTKLLPIKGAVECLFEMGFQEAETHLVFPKSASVEQLKLIRESIAAERDQRLGGGRPAQQPASAPRRPVATSGTPTPQPSSMSFFVTLQSNFQHVMLYENAELQQKARSAMPHQEMSSAAQSKLEEARRADPGCRVGLEDFLVVELLRWFKQDFFSWVDSLPCGRCGGPTQNSGSLGPTPEDLRWGAQRVENHFCSGCQLSTRFPRYNNPEKLLQTRRGRCGEWANCFTLCCRAVGLEARYVWDSTDHVWTEVFSPSQRRWLHCDSCENACDKPLLYELGWGKKLAYILAFSKDQVVDVTWRYSCRHPEVLSRRTRVQEAWLLDTINRLNGVAVGFVFSPTEQEKQQRLLHVRYGAAADQYCRVSSGSELTPGWDRCAWSKQAVFRKLEADWRMVYLARTEGSAVGRLGWRFDLAPAGMTIKSVSVAASSQTFHSGTVCWTLQSDRLTTEFSGDGSSQSFPGLSGASELTVWAELGGGDGEASWQHSQLFRQSLEETDLSSLEIIIHLQDA
uniref:Peptide-N(4)-(N-acetyl-beta-glucosaminyl)asparagine amidase n=1 Tax=Salarias fasciatus TaxID=181472 RepID=A0A672IM87_SALFA